jgi:hypothetical protein
MQSTAQTLRAMATRAARDGIHTGEQFASHETGALDISGLAFVTAEDTEVPAEFYVDEDASIRLIECSAGAMLAIKAISSVLDTEPCATEIAPGHDVPDYIEHVSIWAMTPPVFETRPPSLSEVIGRILRAADHIDTANQAEATAA